MIWKVLRDLRKCLVGLSLVLIATSGCSHSSQTKSSTDIPTGLDQADLKTRTEIESAWQSYHRGQFEKAFLGFRDFEKNNPSSPYVTEARIGTGRALIGLKEYQQAIEVFRGIAKERKSSHPRLAGLSLFYSASAFEALGEYSLMKATLRDAEGLSEHLPDEVRELLLPIKMSVADLMTEDISSANKNIDRAEQALIRFQLENREGLGVSELNLEIAKALTPTPQEDTFVPQLRYFQRSQPFYVRAIESEQEPWATAALHRLMDSYRDFLQLAENPKVNLTMDPRAVQRERMDLMANRLNLIDETLNRLTLLQKTEWQNQNKKELFQLMEFTKQTGSRIEEGLRKSITGSVQP